MRWSKLHGWPLLLIGLCTAQLAAQDTPWNGLRGRWLRTDTIGLLDSFTIVPQSIRLTPPGGDTLSSNHLSVENGLFRWEPTPPYDSVYVRYRVLPVKLSEAFSVLDSTRLQTSPEGILIGSYDPNAPSGRLIDNNNLNYSGSFSRGFSFGNRQDLVLNSSFNLQMAGELGDGIQVTAAITDENLPIQPEGNTRQLRDFDRVFIRLERDNLSLTAGDYELRRPPGHFMQYFKKLEGATFQHRTAIGEAGSWTNSASLAIARGQFRRQPITANEGNQGPYKLQGASGERFIIVLAGTERVFLDGQLMERGRDADYTIDYNQGELTFMARRLITKDSRIVVEFEFADQRYLRSLYALNTHYQAGRWEGYVNLYSQQDSRTATADLDLTETERQLLREAGDQTGGALVSTIDTLDAPNSQRATYRLADTTLLCAGGMTSFSRLVYDPEGTYTATFSFVGEGRGSYELDAEQTANERVYRWVGPDTSSCQLRGSYEPIRQLAAPQLQRMLTAGGRYQIGRRGSLRMEGAFSTEDLNRFSSFDSADDQGWAGRLDWEQSIPLSSDTNRWSLQTGLGYEYVDVHFKPINPYRSPEFLRDWSLANVNGMGSTEAATEHLGSGQLVLKRADWGQLGYRVGFFDREALYSGLRHQGDLLLQRPTLKIAAQSSWLDSEGPDLQTLFWRPNFRLEKKFTRLDEWNLLLEAQAEKNERRTPGSEELSASSFFFQRYVAGLRSPEREKYQFGLNYRQRRDFAPREAEFAPSTVAHEGEIEGQWQPSTAWRGSGRLTFRELRIQDSTLTEETATRTLLGRIDINANLWKGALRTGATYEIGSGQEPRVEYTYLFVGAGQGQYIWLDSLYNNDGKIQPNEMEIAPFPDIADHVRVSIFTDEFIRTDNVTLNQNLQITPARLWSQPANHWQRMVSRFDWQSSLTVNRKTRGFPGVQTWNPLQINLPDSALVALTANQRHSLFFNRRSTKYDAQLEYTDLRNRLVPTTGYESRLRQTVTLRLRWNITDATNLQLEGSRTSRSSDSEFFDNKDYRLEGFQLQPALTYQPGRDFRFSLKYLWQGETNELPDTEEALDRHEFTFEGNYQRWLRVSVSTVQIGLDGDARSPVGFTLLNGLQPGRNWLWSASLTRQLGRFLQMTLSYDGRQTGEAAAVHVGRAQVTALF